MEQRQRIMIVDDNIIDQMITAHVIKNANVNRDVLVMSSAAEALNYLDIHKNDLKEIPTLILLDIDMPIMSGFDFLNKFRNFTAKLKKVCKIVVITGSDIPENIEKMKADPSVSQLILKPLNRNELTCL